MPPAYSPSISPAARRGSSAYGMVPGAIGLPNPAGDLAARYPNLSGANEQLSSNIMSQLEGELSPETVDALRQNAAQFGVSSGMPGSDFAKFKGLRSLGLATEQMQGEGLRNYLAAITGISNTQTVRPELQTEIATQNAVWNAAPDPQMAAMEQLRRFEDQLSPESTGVSTEVIPVGPNGEPLTPTSPPPRRWRTY